MTKMSVLVLGQGRLKKELIYVSFFVLFHINITDTTFLQVYPSLNVIADSDFRQFMETPKDKSHIKFRPFLREYAGIQVNRLYLFTSGSDPIWKPGPYPGVTGSGEVIQIVQQRGMNLKSRRELKMRRIREKSHSEPSCRLYSYPPKVQPESCQKHSKVREREEEEYFIKVEPFPKRRKSPTRKYLNYTGGRRSSADFNYHRYAMLYAMLRRAELY